MYDVVEGILFPVVVIQSFGSPYPQGLLMVLEQGIDHIVTEGVGLPGFVMISLYAGSIVAIESVKGACPEVTLTVFIYTAYITVRQRLFYRMKKVRLCPSAHRHKESD